MAPFDDFNKHIHRITELTNVFVYLIQDRAMCDTQVACDLFFDLSKEVRNHIELVDKQLCGRLVSNPDQAVRNTANRFLGGSLQIKKIFADYLKRWCFERSRKLRIDNHELFIKDTNEMFDLVLDRIQRETEHLFPLVRKLEGEEPRVA